MSLLPPRYVKLCEEAKCMLASKVSVWLCARSAGVHDPPPR